MVEKVQENPQIEVLTNSTPAEFKGEGHLETVVLRDTATDKLRELRPAGVFVFIGLTPNSGWLPPEIQRDQYGFVITNPMLATSLPGVFAAGDVRLGSTKQAASAAGEGATAALMIREYLKKM